VFGIEKRQEAAFVDLLRQFCVAIRKNDGPAIVKLEPQVKQIGIIIHGHGGIAEMRRVFDLVVAVTDARPLEVSWDGIGEWRASTPAAAIRARPSQKSDDQADILTTSIAIQDQVVEVEFFDAKFCTGQQNDCMTCNLDLSIRFSAPVFLQTVIKNLVASLTWKSGTKRYEVIANGDIPEGIVVTMVGDWGRDRPPTPPVEAPPWADLFWLEHGSGEPLGRITVRGVP
jgi:hypothetical protein